MSLSSCFCIPRSQGNNFGLNARVVWHPENPIVGICPKNPPRIFRINRQLAGFWQTYLTGLPFRVQWLFFKVPTQGGPKLNRLQTLSAPGAGKGLFRSCMHPAPKFASIPCLRGPGPMHNHHPPAKQTASHQQRVQPDSYFLAGIVLARIWIEFSIIELPNTLKSVSQGRLVE